MNSNLRKLLDHFNKSLTQARRSETKTIAIDKEELCDLLSEVEAMLAVEAAKSR